MRQPSLVAPSTTLGPPPQLPAARGHTAKEIDAATRPTILPETAKMVTGTLPPGVAGIPYMPLGHPHAPNISGKYNITKRISRLRKPEGDKDAAPNNMPGQIPPMIPDMPGPPPAFPTMSPDSDVGMAPTRRQVSNIIAENAAVAVAEGSRYVPLAVLMTTLPPLAKHVVADMSTAAGANSSNVSTAATGTVAGANGTMPVAKTGAPSGGAPCSDCPCPACSACHCAAMAATTTTVTTTTVPTTSTRPCINTTGVTTTTLRTAGYRQRTLAPNPLMR